MSGRLSGKRTLITGGTTGIGLASAQRFIEEGARVAVTGRNPETLAEARNLLGDKALVIESDAGDVSAQQSLVAKVVKAFGGIDVAFLNAGTGTFQPIEAIEEAEFDRQFNINLKGPMFLLKALSPHLGKGASSEDSAMPYVNLQITRGASREQKAGLVADITSSLVQRLGKRPEHIHIVIQEINEDDWVYAGELTDVWRARIQPASGGP